MAVEQPEDDGFAPVEMTLTIPGLVMRDYQILTDCGLYLSVQEALRASLVTGWRYDRGSYHSLRIDLARHDEGNAAEEDRQSGPVAPNSAEAG